MYLNQAGACTCVCARVCVVCVCCVCVVCVDKGVFLYVCVFVSMRHAQGNTTVSKQIHYVPLPNLVYPGA